MRKTCTRGGGFIKFLICTVLSRASLCETTIWFYEIMWLSSNWCRWLTLPSFLLGDQWCNFRVISMEVATVERANTLMVVSESCQQYSGVTWASPWPVEPGGPWRQVRDSRMTGRQTHSPVAEPASVRALPCQPETDTALVIDRCG